MKFYSVILTVICSEGEILVSIDKVIFNLQQESLVEFTVRKFRSTMQQELSVFQIQRRFDNKIIWKIFFFLQILSSERQNVKLVELKLLKIN